MSYNYIVPQKLADDDRSRVDIIRQDKRSDVSWNTMHQSAITVAGKRCTLVNDSLPSGMGGLTVRLYNFTDQAIAMVDTSNGLTIFDPIPYSGSGYSREVSGQLIIVDVIYTNQDKRLNYESEQYISHREKALAGLSLTTPAGDGLVDDSSGGDILTKASTNRIYRYHIRADKSQMEKYNGCFYFKEADICIGCVTDPNTIIIHPKSPDQLLLKARPTLEGLKSLGCELGVNDAAHNHSRVFVNAFGTVMEVPITRDPLKADGITIWDNVHQPHSAPTFYSFGDKGKIPIKIYSSISDAEAGGAPDKLIELGLIKEKIKLAENKLIQDREDFERYKLKETLNYDKDIMSIHQAKEKLAFEANERKRSYEERDREYARKKEDDSRRDSFEAVSFWRKFAMEGVKVITTIASVATIYFGWKIKNAAN